MIPLDPKAQLTTDKGTTFVGTTQKVMGNHRYRTSFLQKAKRVLGRRGRPFQNDLPLGRDRISGVIQNCYMNQNLK